MIKLMIDGIIGLISLAIDYALIIFILYLITLFFPYRENPKKNDDGE